MNTNLYEVDLLQKYRQSISKRYRGYNRVYQLNVNKLNQNSHSIQALSQKKQIKHTKSPIIQITKHCFSQNHSNPPNVARAIVIRSTNAQFSLKQVSTQTQFNNKKFMKTKLLQNNKYDQEDSKNPQNTSRILQHSVQQYIENKFKFRKKFLKDQNKNQLSQQNQRIIKNELMKLQPFSPVIRGEKKNPLYPQNKKTKTQNQTIQKDEQSKRQIKNMTQVRKQRINENLTRLKRANSFISQKTQNQQIIQSLSTSIQPSKLIKKFSSNFKSKQIMKQKQSDLAKVSFPKINCAKQMPKQNQNVFIPSVQIQKNKQKYRKTPLLIRYQFDPKTVESQSFILMQAESQVILYGQRFNSAYQIASLTKIMTFYVVIKLIEQYDIDPKKQMIQVESTSSNIGGTTADLFAGQIYSLQNLLYGMMLPSGNDAALTLATWGGKFKSSNPEDIQSCINQFVILMNKQAKNLNLIDTRFGNPHGLPHKMSRSTAMDVAKLSIASMNNELFKKVVSTRFYKCVASTKDGRKRFNEWENTNKLLRRQGFIGIKTGITITAGPCLATAYKFRDKIYICVILRAKKISRRFKQTRRLINWCLNKFYGDTLTDEQLNILKNLRKNNVQLDSDYSQDESIFCYDVNSSKQYRKRCDIISEM